MKAPKIVGAQRRKLQRHVPHQGHDIIALGLVIEPSRATDAMADPGVRGEPEVFPGTVFVSHCHRYFRNALADPKREPAR